MLAEQTHPTETKYETSDAASWSFGGVFSGINIVAQVTSASTRALGTTSSSALLRADCRADAASHDQTARWPRSRLCRHDMWLVVVPQHLASGCRDQTEDPKLHQNDPDNDRLVGGDNTHGHWHRTISRRASR